MLFKQIITKKIDWFENNPENSCTKKVPNVFHQGFQCPHIVFHNGTSYDYHFIIKEWPENLEKQFTCLGENTEIMKKDIVDSFWLLHRISMDMCC